MNNLPLITIAICTYNRADYLRDTLADLRNQTVLDDRTEIIVINNNSDDHTNKVCDDFDKRNPNIQFRAIKEGNQGLSYARNRAVEESDGDAILYIDDDVILPDNFVETLHQYSATQNTVKASGGKIHVSFDGDDPDWIPKQLMPMFGHHDLGKKDCRYPASNFPRGGNMFIRKEVFQKYGLFDTSLGRIGKSLLGSEEKAFFDRLKQNGEELMYWGDLKLWHRIGDERLSEEYLKKQSIGIGASERLRVKSSVIRTSGKLMSELVKMGGSLVLSSLQLLNGNNKAALFLLKFRIWVLSGFLNPEGN